MCKCVCLCIVSISVGVGAHMHGVMCIYGDTINPPLTLLSPSPPYPLPHRSFMQVCQEALDLNGHLISTDQLMYQDELRNKFQQMQATLTPLLQAEEKVCGVSVCLSVCLCMLCDGSTISMVYAAVL